ncbi:MAG TPA: ABC transporter permease, partial [Acidimicrobiales bacterium]|nr:ABC transporter permease [Acidimicrobiales bacterium]
MSGVLLAAKSQTHTSLRAWFASAGTARRTIAVVGTYVVCASLFGLVVGLQHANPIGVYQSLFESAITNPGALGEVVLRAVPICLAALAVSVPARAGLVNVGGEGQLIVGAVATTGVGVALQGSIPGPLDWAAMAVAAMVCAGTWAGACGFLRTRLGANEAVTTLLLNFVANDLMLYLIYQPWKDPAGNGQPESRPLTGSAVLPHFFGSSLNLGVIVAIAAAAAIWFSLQKTGWGFALRVVGGNKLAAKRSGLPVNHLLISSMFVGGALAGLGGMLNLAGAQLQLLPGGTATYGYIGFLASFLGRHHPVKVVVAAL